MSTKKLKINNKELQVQEGLLRKIALDQQRKKDGYLQMASGNNLYLADRVVSSQSEGAVYPGRINFETMRVLAKGSALVDAIIKLRAQQVAKLEIDIVPKDSGEPSRQIHLLKYSTYDIQNHPAFDYGEKKFLLDIFERIDPDDSESDKRKKFIEAKDNGEFETKELSSLQGLIEKHDNFYKKRDEDIKRIKKILERPDKFFTESSYTWNQFIAKMLRDILTLDRGVFVKYRNQEGEIEGLMPIDGLTIRPVVYEYGFIDPERAYVQVADNVGNDYQYLSKRDTVVMSMNTDTDMHRFGYGESPIEVLYTLILTDLFIDQGNLSYYRKGGSIPEGMVAIEPPSSKDGIPMQLSQEQIQGIQRQLQAIMMGDFTQVPIISGGKVQWIDFKGKRRDMQFKELAEYVAKKICMVYQVSPQDLGFLDGFKTSDGKVQSEMTRSKGLQTLMSFISEAITYHVIEEIRPEADLKLWFKEDDLEREKQKWDILSGKLDKGVITINEARAEYGKDPKPWGSVPLVGLKSWEKKQDMGAGGMPLPPPIPGMGGAGAPPMPPTGPLPPMDFAKGLGESRLFWDVSDVDTTVMENLYLDTAKIPENLKNDLLSILNDDVPSEVKIRKSTYSEISDLMSSIGIDYVFKSFENDDFLYPSYIENGQILIDKEVGSDSIFKSISYLIYEKIPEIKNQIPQKERAIEAIERLLVERSGDSIRESYEEHVLSHRIFKSNLKDVRLVEKIIYEKV